MGTVAYRSGWGSGLEQRTGTESSLLGTHCFRLPLRGLRFLRLPLLRFHYFHYSTALLAVVVAVIVSSVFDPLTGTQIHRLAAC